VLAVCLSVTHSVILWAITEQVISRFHWSLVLWLGLPIGRTVPGTDSGSLFHFPRHRGIASFRGLISFLMISHITSRFLWYLAKWLMPTYTTFLHFRTDPADIRIRIRINPKIRVWIPDHFWFGFCPKQTFALFKHSLVCVVFVRYDGCGHALKSQTANFRHKISKKIRRSGFGSPCSKSCTLEKFILWELTLNLLSNYANRKRAMTDIWSRDLPREVNIDHYINIFDVDDSDHAQSTSAIKLKQIVHHHIDMYKAVTIEWVIVGRTIYTLRCAVSVRWRFRSVKYYSRILFS